MAFDPTYPFLALLLAYMVYSQWTRLDSRYLILAALVLLVITAAVDAAGAIGTANVLAVYVFYLLAGGVLLLVIDHIREERASRSSAPPKTPAATERMAPSPKAAAGDEAAGPSS